MSSNKKNMLMILTGKYFNPAMLCLFILMPCLSFAQRPVPSAYPNNINVNFIRTWAPTAPEKNGDILITRPLKDVKMTTQYVDGLGRPLQTVAKEGSLVTDNTATDLVKTNEFDEYGREQYQYLVSPDPGINGQLKTNPFAAQAAFMNAQYGGQNEAFFYGQNQYESSPLNRIEKTFAPGNAGIGNNKSLTIKQLFNTTLDDVKMWSVISPYRLSIEVIDKLNGTQDVTWSVNNFNATMMTMIYLYRPAGSTGSYTTAYVSGAVSSRVRNIPLGNYEYGLQIIFNNGTPSETLLQNNNFDFGTYTMNGAYPAGKLYKQLTIDQDGKQVVVFTDKEGKTILKKIQSKTVVSDNGSGSGHTDWLCTYYLYDEFNKLRCVIQPAGVESISNNWLLDNSEILAQQCFRYEYDQRDRMIAKKIPGAAAVYMVYDDKNRLVLMQDGNMRTGTVKWLYTKYDDLNRPIETGLWNNTASLSTHLANAVGKMIYPDLTSQSYEILTNNFYDGYEWINTSGNPVVAGYQDTYDAYLAPAQNDWPYAQANSQSFQVQGMLTGTKTKVLGAATYLYTLMIYDAKGRMIQLKSTNVSGGTDINTNQFTWSGQILRTVQKIAGPDGNDNVIISKNNFDHLGRVVKTEKKLPNLAIFDDPTTGFVTTSQMKYDALGQMKTKLVGTTRDVNGNYTTTAIETLAYEYNIGGLLLGMNRPFTKDDPLATGNYFGFDLGYDRNAAVLIGGYGYSAPLYNGNITGITWKSKGDGEKRKYDFKYDAANRLLAADFNQYSSGYFNKNANIDFSVKMGDGLNESAAYDANGNIKRMQQWGLKLNTSSQIDDLLYSYNSNSNRLSKVTDNVVTADNGKLGDFKDGANAAADDYGYDVNGNLTIDKNKAINSIIYNHLNLPSVINVDGKGTITYQYDAAGNKLSKITNEPNGGVLYNGTNVATSITTTTNYLGGAVYESKDYGNPVIPASMEYANKLQFLNQEEGRIRILPESSPGFAYDYFLKDHLGNVRMVLTDETKVNKYPAATMEGSLTAGANSMVNFEKGFYKVDDSKIVAEPWTGETVANTKLYYNYNSIPPGNLNYPASCTPVQNDGSAKVYKLNATTNKTGLEFVMKVMAGDKVDILGKSYYVNSTPITNANSNTLNVAALLTNFLTAPGNMATAKGFNEPLLTSINSTLLPTSLFRGNNSESPTTIPKAYINYIFFDEQFKYAGSSGFSRVGASSGMVKDHWLVDASLQNIAAPKNGYIFVYVSNESNLDVFFDNLQVIHKPGPIMEETHYYPFGLTMAGISSKAGGVIENKLKFNGGNELQSREFSDGSGLEIFDANNRVYDQQLGRFLQPDELADANWEITPYNFAINNPILYNDPLGLNEEKSTIDKPKELTNIIIKSVRKLDHYQMQSLYWDLRSSGKGFESVGNPKLKERLERWDGVARYMQEVHKGVKKDGMMMLEIASTFIPLGGITKVRYLKYAVRIFKYKRGVAAVADLTGQIVANKGDLLKVNPISIASAALIKNPFMSSVPGGIINLSYDNISENNIVSDMTKVSTYKAILVNGVGNYYGGQLNQGTVTVGRRALVEVTNNTAWSVFDKITPTD